MEFPPYNEALVERRRQLGLTIQQVAQDLNMREEVIAAFEDGDFGQVPQSGYGQAMLSTYARHLGLNPIEILSSYTEAYEQYRRGGRRRATGRAGRERYPGAGASEPARDFGPSTDGNTGVYATRTRPRGYYPEDEGDVAGQGVYDAGGYEPDDGFDQGAHEDLDATQAYTYVGTRPDYDRERLGAEPGQRGAHDEYGSNGDERYQHGTAARDARTRTQGSYQTGRRRPVTRTRTARGASTRPSAGAGRRRLDESRGGLRRTNRSSRSVAQMVADHLGAILFVVAAIIIVVIVLTVNSCIRSQTEEAKTVPVSSIEADEAVATNEADVEDVSTASSANAADDETTTVSGTTADDEDASGYGSAGGLKTIGDGEDETSVTVIVADGAVTWLSVECDGKTMISGTVTGPINETYDVEEAITVQAGDTSAVSVVRDGRQVQFDSESGGIGSVRIQGPGKKSSSSASAGTTAGADSATGTSTYDSAGGSAGSTYDEDEGYGQYDGYADDGTYGQDSGYAGYDTGAYDEGYGESDGYYDGGYTDDGYAYDGEYTDDGYAYDNGYTDDGGYAYDEYGAYTGDVG